MNENQQNKDNSEDLISQEREQEIKDELERLVSDDSSSEKQDDGIRTFAEDIRDEMKSKKTSLASIALAEQNRSQQYQTIATHEKKVNTLYAVFAMLCILGGFVAIAFVVRENSDTPVSIPSSIPVKANSLFAYEDEKLFSVDGLSRAELIARFLETTRFIKTKGITNILMTTERRTLSGAEFLGLVGLNFDKSSLSAISSDFMVGFSIGQSEDTFIVMQHNNPDVVRTAFRVWEPFLIDDLGRLLQIETPTNFLATRSFQSEFVENKEARVVRDESGGFVVGYVFFDTETIILSTSVETLETLISRLTIQY